MSLSEENRPWSHCFEKHREGLLQQAAQKLSPVLQRRITAEDVVQETLLNACKRQAFFENRPEIPTFRKLLIVLEQTIAALERRHLQSGKRDIYKEVAVQTAIGSTNSHWQHAESVELGDVCGFRSRAADPSGETGQVAIDTQRHQQHA